VSTQGQGIPREVLLLVRPAAQQEPAAVKHPVLLLWSCCSAPPWHLLCQHGL